MLGDDAGAPPPIQTVCRSATIALRKATLAKETGDTEEELAQLRVFNRTVINVLHFHPMYARRKEDAEVAGLDAKLTDVHRRIQDLGGVVAAPSTNIIEAAASVAAARLVASGGRVSLLERRRASRAGSRVGSRVSTAAPSRDASPDSKRGVRHESSPPASKPPPHSGRAVPETSPDSGGGDDFAGSRLGPMPDASDLSRRLGELEAAEKARAARDARTETRIANLAHRASEADVFRRKAEARAETAERLVWELQEAMEALTNLSAAGAEDVTSRVERLEARAREELEKSALASPTAGRLAFLEAQVLPTRVAELEQRVAELAISGAGSGSGESATPGTNDPPGNEPGGSPEPPFSDEVRDLLERVARLESVEVESAGWARAAESKAASALARVDALSETVALVGKTPTPQPVASPSGDDAELRAAVEALGVRVRRAEASAAAAMDLAGTTSPGTARVNSVVPDLRNRVTATEIGVEAAAERLAEVESKLKTLEKSFPFPEPPGANTATPLEAGKILETAVTMATDVARDIANAVIAKLLSESSSLAETVDSLREAREKDHARVADLEGSVKSAVSATEALREVVRAVETKHRDAASHQADAVREVVAAAAGAAAALPRLWEKLAELESSRGEAAAVDELREGLERARGRLTTLEADTETASGVSAKLAERFRELKKQTGELYAAVRGAVSAESVRIALGSVSGKIARLAQETADAVDALRNERREKTDLGECSSTGKTPAFDGSVSKALKVAEEARAIAVGAATSAKNAKQFAETAASAPARFAAELAAVVEALREARGMDKTEVEALERRVGTLEARGNDRLRGGDEASATTLEVVRGGEPDLASLVSSVPETPTTEPPPANEASSETNRNRIAAVEEEIASLRARVVALVESKNENRRGTNARGSSPPAPHAPVDADATSVAFGCAEAAASATETLAEAVAGLQIRLTAVEAAAVPNTAPREKARERRGAVGSKPSLDTCLAPRDLSGVVSDDRASLICVSEDPGGTTDRENVNPKTKVRGSHVLFATESAAAAEASAMGGSASLDPNDDDDLIQRAKLAAAKARRSIREEAWRLGITLSGFPDSENANVPPSRDPEDDLVAVASERAEAAVAADRELAAELATVCALVEKEEARRETLRVALSVEDPLTGEPSLGADDDASSVAVAARREWAARMEAQLRRLRAAAREAESLNAAAAEALTRGDRCEKAGGVGGRSNARSRVIASRLDAERREAAVADRLVRLSKRLDARFGARVGAGEEEDGVERLRNVPWGSGPGLKPGGSTGKSSHPRSRVDAAISALERRVDAVASRAGSGCTENASVPLSESGPGAESQEGFVRSLELKSLRQMMRRAQTEMGALAVRVHSVETKVAGVTTVERDLRSARLSDGRAAENAAAVSVVADAARASERASNAEREVNAIKAQVLNVSEACALQREGLLAVHKKLDALARDVDVSVKTAEAAADRARGRARSADASAKTAEAKVIGLAGELGRVARHVGLTGVGDALRTRVLFDPVDPPGEGTSASAEDAEDRFEITTFTAGEAH